MAKTVHLVPEDRFPLTKCGVDIVVKTGADWVLDTEEGWQEKVTCSNCIKGLNKGKPMTTARKESIASGEGDKVSFPFQDHMDKLRRYQDKITSLKMNVKAAMSDETVGECERKELETVGGWLEAAEDAMKIAVLTAHGEWIEMKEKGGEGEVVSE